MAPIRDDFGSVRPIRRLNRLTQALLAIALALVVNFLASLPEFRLRHDITADRRHSLAPESAETVRAAGRRSPVGVGRNQGWVKAVLITDEPSEPAQVSRARLLRLRRSARGCAAPKPLARLPREAHLKNDLQSGWGARA